MKKIFNDWLHKNVNLINTLKKEFGNKGFIDVLYNTEEFEQLVASVNNNTEEEQTLFNSGMMKRMGSSNGTGFVYTDWQDMDNNYFNVPNKTSNNHTIEYKFNAGNSTNPFYSPILKTSSSNPINITVPLLYNVHKNGHDDIFNFLVANNKDIIVIQI